MVVIDNVVGGGVIDQSAGQEQGTNVYYHRVLEVQLLNLTEGWSNRSSTQYLNTKSQCFQPWRRTLH